MKDEEEIFHPSSFDTVGTAKTHTNPIYRKLNVRSRVQICPNYGVKTVVNNAEDEISVR